LFQRLLKDIDFNGSESLCVLRHEHVLSKWILRQSPEAAA
jgi:hypothetical protein